MTTTNGNVQTLAKHFQRFNQQLIAFVEQCSAPNWRKITKAEGWPVGVTAHHIAAIHYPVFNWVQMIVEGRPTPAISMSDVDQMNLQHFKEHTGCTPAEVIALLRSEGDKAFAYLNTLDDAALKREAYLKVLETTISAGQLFTVVLIDEAEQHLASMQSAVLESQ